MGLHVEHLPLFHQQGTLSILFFCVGTVQVADDQQKSAYVSKVNIPAGTIVGAMEKAFENPDPWLEEHERKMSRTET